MIAQNCCKLDTYLQIPSQRVNKTPFALFSNLESSRVFRAAALSSRPVDVSSVPCEADADCRRHQKLSSPVAVLADAAAS